MWKYVLNIFIIFLQSCDGLFAYVMQVPSEARGIISPGAGITQALQATWCGLWESNLDPP